MVTLSNHDLMLAYLEQASVLGKLSSEIRDRGIAWQHLAEYGLKTQAVVLYYRLHKCSLSDAREAVESFLRV